MKKIVLTAMIIMSAIAGNAKESNATDPTPDRSFSFVVYGDIPVAKVAFEEEHFLGDAVSPKWNTFLHNYTRTYDVSVGLSSEGVELRKPAIYKAVQRANKWVRQSVRKGSFSKEEAVKVMSHVLDCANVIIYEEDTASLEKAANEAKTGEDAVNLFKHVTLTRQ